MVQALGPKHRSRELLLPGRIAAIELAHDVSADGPRCDLGRRGLLALAVRTLVR